MIYLRSDVIWGTTECSSRYIALDSFFTHSKIGNFAMAISIQQNVIQFQITIKIKNCINYLKFVGIWLKNDSPVNDPMFVKKLQRKDYFSRIETGSRLVKFSGSLDLKHQVTTVDVLHDKE